MGQTGFIDLHQHVLWGLDDGAQSFDQTREMLRLASQEGTRVIAATPHMLPGVQPFDCLAYRRRLQEAQEYCDAQRLLIRLIPGCEMRYTPMTPGMLEDGRIPTIGGTEYVLVEFHPEADWDEIFSGVNSILRKGFIPILAHVERYRCFRRSASTAIRIKRDYEVYYQVNADSILRKNGWLTSIFIGQMFRARAIDLIASDAHDCTYRPPSLRPAVEHIQKCYGKACAQAVTQFGEGLF